MEGLIGALHLGHGVPWRYAAERRLPSAPYLMTLAKDECPCAEESTLTNSKVSSLGRPPCLPCVFNVGVGEGCEQAAAQQPQVPASPQPGLVTL